MPPSKWTTKNSVKKGTTNRNRGPSSGPSSSEGDNQRRLIINIDSIEQLRNFIRDGKITIDAIRARLVIELPSGKKIGVIVVGNIEYSCPLKIITDYLAAAQQGGKRRRRTIKKRNN